MEAVKVAAGFGLRGKRGGGNSAITYGFSQFDVAAGFTPAAARAAMKAATTYDLPTG